MRPLSPRAGTALTQAASEKAPYGNVLVQSSCQYRPSPRPINSHQRRWSGVPCTRRGNHAGRTVSSRPSSRTTWNESGKKATSTASGSVSSVKVCIPCPHEFASMPFHDAAEIGDLSTAQTSARDQFQRIRPEFRHPFPGGYMDMRRLSGITFVTVEEKPVWAFSQKWPAEGRSGLSHALLFRLFRSPEVNARPRSGSVSGRARRKRPGCPRVSRKIDGN